MTTSELHRAELKRTDRFFKILFLFFALAVISGGIFEHVSAYSDIACIELSEEESNKSQETKKDISIDDYTHVSQKLKQLIHENDFVFLHLKLDVRTHCLDVPTLPPEHA